MCYAVIIDVCVSSLSNTRCGCGKKLTPMGLPIRNIFTNRIKFGWKGMFRRRTISSSFLYAISRLVPVARFIERFRTDLFYWGYLLEANGTGRNSRQHNITKNWHTAEERRAKKHNYWPTADTGGLRDRRLAMLQPVAERHRFECLSGEDWEYQPIPAAWVINDQQTSQ